MKQEELTPFEQSQPPETTEGVIEALPETPEAQQEEMTLEKAAEIVSKETERTIKGESAKLETRMNNLGFSGEETEALKQETGIDTELKANTEEILSLADETTRQFTKEYSPKWRNAEAKRIRDMRREYFKKKQTITQENEARAETRTAVESELSAKEKEMAEHAETLRKLDDEIVERKNAAWFKIKNMFGFSEELPEERVWSEKISELREVKREAEEKKRLLTETEEVVLDNAELKLAKEEVRKFYEEQKGIKDIFEQEKDKKRNVAEVAKQKRVLFLHALPSNGEEANTAMNNPNVVTSAMGILERAKMLIGLEPTISVSTKQLSTNGVEQEKAVIQKTGGHPVLYRAGLILNGGNIMSAYGGDAGTLAEGTKRRFSKYDSSLRSTIQEDFSHNLDTALEHRIEKYGPTNSGINELVIKKPSVSGSFSYFTAPVGREKFLENNYGNLEDFEPYRQNMERQQIRYALSALELSKGLGMPAYGVKENGAILDLLDEDFTDVLPEEVMAKKFSFSTNDRINYVKNSMGFSQNEILTKEAQQKLEEIAQMEPDENDKNTLREEYRSRAEHIIHALSEKYDGIYELLRHEVFKGSFNETATMPEALQFIQNERNYSPQAMEIMQKDLSSYASVEDALRGNTKRMALRKKLIDKTLSLGTP